MDCIDSNGNTFIGYAALLNWKKLTLKYSSQLIYTSQDGVIEKSSLRKTEFPFYHNKTLNWRLKYTNTKASWVSCNNEINEQLLNSEKGDVEWSCTQPKAEAEISSLKNTLFKGLGYTEHLKLTIKPWELPIDELRWGRFLSKSHTVVWINWLGPKPINLCYVNGVLIKDIKVSDFELKSESEGLELVLNNSVTLRKGSLISTVLSRFTWLRKVFPEKILVTFECKWRSAGILKMNNLETCPGWAIHEVVKWN